MSHARVERDARICALLASGWRYGAIATETGCSFWTVLKIAKVNGLAPGGGRPRTGCARSTRNQEIAALAQANELTFAAIGKRYGLTGERVRRIASAMGVTWTRYARHRDAAHEGEGAAHR